MRRNNYKLLFLVLVLAALTGLTAQASAKAAAPARGNTPGNSISWSYAAESDGKAYFVKSGGYDAGIYVADISTGVPKNPVKLRTGIDFSNLNVIDGFIYFKALDGLYRMKLNGTSPQRLTTDDVAYVNIADGFIVYTTYSDNDDYGRIIRMNKDGTKRVVLTKMLSQSTNILNETIYFVGAVSDGFSLYSIKINGSQLKRISNLPIEKVCAAEDGYLYVIGADAKGNRGIYRMKYDGTGMTKLSDKDAWQINVSGGYLYFYDVPEKVYYRIKSSGGAPQKVYAVGEEPYGSMAVLNDHVVISTEANTIFVDVKTLKAETMTGLPTYKGDAVINAYDFLDGKMRVSVTGVKAGIVEFSIRSTSADVKKVYFMVERGKTYIVSFTASNKITTYFDPYGKPSSSDGVSYEISVENSTIRVVFGAMTGFYPTITQQ